MRYLVLLLMVFALPASAKWVKISENEEATLYFDQSRLKKTENFPRVWHLQDLKKIEKNGALSRLMLIEFDCKGDRYRFLSFSEYAQSMAQGNRLSSTSYTSEWEYNFPNSSSEFMYRLFCK